jgi:hypothetical protein
MIFTKEQRKEFEEKESRMDRELIMKQWDSWREYIASGGLGTWPRDAFEALLDYFEEQIRKKESRMDRTQRDIDDCELESCHYYDITYPKHCSKGIANPHAMCEILSIEKRKQDFYRGSPRRG